MSAPLVRLAASTVLAGTMLLGAGVAFGAPTAPKDGEALALAKKAIYGDYLGTKFADAEKKLKQALALCEGADACSAKVRAQILCDLGVIYVGGMNRVDDGKEQFVAALKEDPQIVPDPDLVSPEVEAAFADAKKPDAKKPDAKKAGARPKPAPATDEAPPAASAAKGDLVHTPPAEQATLTPVPLYAELPAGQTAARVQLSYKPFGASEWKSLGMKSTGKGYSAEIPCAEVGGATGDLAYFIQAFDSTQNLVSWSGSRTAPNKVAIRTSIQGEAPHLPDQAPPARCPDVGDCPPEFPGCHGKGDDAPPACEPGADCPQAAPKPRMNWISLAVQQDFLALSGSTTTCAGGNEYTCFDSTGQYYGGLPSTKSGDQIRGGVGVATTRILAGYDRVIVAGLALGARLGGAFRGGPAAPGGKGFFPFHGEVRASYWFGSDPFARTGPRPYLVLGGGVAQVDSGVNVVLYQSDQDYVTDTRTTLTAWKKAGTGFATGGLGMLLAVTPRQGPFVELKFMELFGATSSAFNLQIGYALGL